MILSGHLKRSGLLKWNFWAKRVAVSPKPDLHFKA